MQTMRNLMRLVEALRLLDERERSEKVRTSDAPIYINPSPTMLIKLLQPGETGESKLRVLDIGDDIAVADAYSYTHRDMWNELRHIAHPITQQSDGAGHLHLNAVRAGSMDSTVTNHFYPWKLGDLQVGVVADDNEAQLPPKEWNDGLRRAMGR